MRLLFAHDHRFRRGPGGELYTVGSFPAGIWDRYLRHFDELHVIARNGGPIRPGANLAKAEREGVSFELLPSLSTPRQLLLRSRRFDNQMHAAVEAADAVVARLPSEIGLLAIRHAKRAGKPYAVEVVGCAWDGSFNYGGLSGRIYAPVAFARNRRAIREAPFALYVTSSWLQQRYPTSGSTASASNVALQPMDAGGVSRLADRLAAIAAGERPLLGTVASLFTKSKGVQTAMAAIARLRSEGLELRYRVLGPGIADPWRQLADKLGVSDLVRFDGTRKAGKEVFDWLDEIDIHLQPSFQEGLPRATIEAMSRGAACIGSTCGGLPELLPPDRLHRPGDITGLANCIKRLVTDADGLARAAWRDLELSKEYLPETLNARRADFYSRLRDVVESGTMAT